MRAHRGTEESVVCRVRKGAVNELGSSTRTRQHRAHHDRSPASWCARCCDLRVERHAIRDRTFAHPTIPCAGTERTPELGHLSSADTTILCRCPAVPRVWALGQPG